MGGRRPQKEPEICQIKTIASHCSSMRKMFRANTSSAFWTSFPTKGSSPISGSTAIGPAKGMNSWKDILLDHSITPIQQYSYTTGKNATDSAMIIDAMDILYAGNVEGFCLVSSDSDFTRLASRLREAGKIVVGMGEKKTPAPFIAACNKFKYLEVLQQEGEEEAAAECQKRKCAEKSEGAAPSTAQTSLREIRRAVRTIIDDSSEDDDQWVPLSTVGNTLIKRFPEFDVRNYGHRKLTSFVKSLDAFEVREVPNPTDDNTKKIYVRTRPGNRNNKKNR